MKLTNTSGQGGESWYPSFRGIKLDVGFGRDTTLTVVSVMQVDGGFLMCADTQVTEEKLRTRGTGTRAVEASAGFQLLGQASVQSLWLS